MTVDMPDLNNKSSISLEFIATLCVDTPIGIDYEDCFRMMIC